VDKRRIGVVLLVAVTVLALAWMSLGALTGGADEVPPPPRTMGPTGPPAASAGQSDAAPSAATLPPLPTTSDPDAYASAVAGVVFGLDTTFAGPDDYRALLMAQADPQMSPRGHADLERMVAERIPEPELWERMRSNGQWSAWTTQDVWQPGAWDEVLTSGQAEPGWALRNVLGTQTTHFRDGGHDRKTSRERTVTIGMRCPAPDALVDRCQLTMVGIGVVS
jgi:hypothetical protein